MHKVRLSVSALPLLDGVQCCVFQQVVQVVVVDLHIRNKHSVAAVFIDNLLKPLSLRNTQQVTVIRLVRSKKSNSMIV